MHSESKQSGGGESGEFDLDLTIVEFGPVSAALLGTTDDGCDTRRDGDC